MVARQAHNLEVVGSNPTPATIKQLLHYTINLLCNVYCQGSSGGQSGGIITHRSRVRVPPLTP